MKGREEIFCRSQLSGGSVLLNRSRNNIGQENGPVHKMSNVQIRVDRVAAAPHPRFPFESLIKEVPPVKFVWLESSRDYPFLNIPFLYLECTAYVSLSLPAETTLLSIMVI